MENFIDKGAVRRDIHRHVGRVFEAWHETLSEDERRTVGLEAFVQRETEGLQPNERQAIYECVRMMELFRESAGGRPTE